MNELFIHYQQRLQSVISQQRVWSEAKKEEADKVNIHVHRRMPRWVGYEEGVIPPTVFETYAFSALKALSFVK